jgi:L-lactate dehydrogenase complex protein LldG
MIFQRIFFTFEGNTMSEEQDKLKFFKSLKNSIFNSVSEIKEIEKNEASLSSLGATTTKAVIPSCLSDDLPVNENVSNSDFLDERFAENFVQSGGKFVYCQDEKQFINYLKSLKEEKDWNHVFSAEHLLSDFLSYNDFQRDEIEFALEDSAAGISYCYKMSANDGVIILSPEQATNRRLVSFPKTHIIIAYKNQLKENISEAIDQFDQKYNGRLASILELHEGKPVTKANHKTLLSADGPKDVYLFYIDAEEVE